eukprot:1157259-Pelagomonas_calceolata.AAC.3
MGATQTGPWGGKDREGKDRRGKEGGPQKGGIGNRVKTQPQIAASKDNCKGSSQKPTAAAAAATAMAVAI